MSRSLCVLFKDAFITETVNREDLEGIVCCLIEVLFLHLPGETE
jgi:hypothetical protein